MAKNARKTTPWNHPQTRITCFIPSLSSECIFYAANGPVLVPKPVICAYLPATGQIWTQLFSPLHIQDCLRCQHSNKIGSPAPANGLKCPILTFSISPWTTSFFANRFRMPNLEHLDVILYQNFKIGPQNANNRYCKFTYRPPTNYWHSMPSRARTNFESQGSQPTTSHHTAGVSTRAAKKKVHQRPD